MSIPVYTNPVSEGVKPIRYKYYYYGSTMAIDLYTKNTQTVTAEFLEDDNTLHITVDGKEHFVGPLYDKITNIQCSFNVVKIEIKFTSVNPDFQTYPYLTLLEKTKAEERKKMQEELAKKMDEEAIEADKDTRKPLNVWLKEAYDKADDDTKKAMLKSYHESGGTVLNSRWEEVKDKRVEPQLPSKK